MDLDQSRITGNSTYQAVGLLPVCQCRWTPASRFQRRGVGIQRPPVLFGILANRPRRPRSSLKSTKHKTRLGFPARGKHRTAGQESDVCRLPVSRVLDSHCVQPNGCSAAIIACKARSSGGVNTIQRFNVADQSPAARLPPRCSRCFRRTGASPSARPTSR
jgi:hypothetical protein